MQSVLSPLCWAFVKHMLTFLQGHFNRVLIQPGWRCAQTKILRSLPYLRGAWAFSQPLCLVCTWAVQLVASIFFKFFTLSFTLNATALICHCRWQCDHASAAPPSMTDMQPPAQLPSSSPSPLGSCTANAADFGQCGGAGSTCPTWLPASACIDAPWPGMCCPQKDQYGQPQVCIRHNQYW